MPQPLPSLDFASVGPIQSYIYIYNHIYIYICVRSVLKTPIHPLLIHIPHLVANKPPWLVKARLSKVSPLERFSQLGVGLIVRARSKDTVFCICVMFCRGRNRAGLSWLPQDDRGLPQGGLDLVASQWDDRAACQTVMQTVMHGLLPLTQMLPQTWTMQCVITLTQEAEIK